MSAQTQAVVLATTHHDPDGRLREQTQRILPSLLELFDQIVVLATSTTQPQSVELLQAHGALVSYEEKNQAIGLNGLGKARRGILELALQQQAETLLFCDFDRMLHWAEFYPEELRQVISQIPSADFTVLGRTERAFRSHPRMQYDTESIINTVYAQVSGNAWDVTAAARGISRRAAQAILENCPDETIGTDVSWPLYCASIGLNLAYLQTEGLEFETADRFADQVARAGGLAQWIAELDANPQRWVERLEVARLEVAAMLPYTKKML